MSCIRESCLKASAYEDGGCYWHTSDRSKPTSEFGAYRLKSREIRRREATRRLINQTHERELQYLRQAARELVGPSHMLALLASSQTDAVLEAVAAS